MLEEKLKKIDEYFISFNKKDDYKGLEVSFPTNWEIKNFEDLDSDKLIESHHQSNGRIIFIGNENVSFVELVEFVELTAITNRENETKDLLLNNKIKELKEIFKTKRLSELESIKFVFTGAVSNEPYKTTDITTEKFTKKKDTKDIKKMIKVANTKRADKSGEDK